MISIEDSLNCFYCFEILVNPIETLCCFNTCCEEHASLFTECPICRNYPLKFSPSVQLRKIIGNLHFVCQYCSYNTTRGEYTVHDKKCLEKPITCNVCEAKVPKSKSLAHVATNHPQEILAVYFGKAQAQEERKSVERDCINLSVRARIGKTGKYYCGKRLDPPCDCCDGFCGRSSGCNCVDCMKLDVLARNLPKGYLVNSFGNICTKSKNGKVYCLCLMKNNKRCGENYQCEDCLRIENNWNKYLMIIN